MRGLNYFKGKDDPVALEDHEYPEWLWRCLDIKKKEGQDEGAGADEFCKLSIPCLSSSQSSGTSFKPPMHRERKLTFCLPAKSKKLRRAAAKRQKKLEARLLASGDMSALEPKIPLTQQSIDLPANEEGTIEGALEAEEKRQELRAALRDERRKKIKETNYLKSM